MLFLVDLLGSQHMVNAANRTEDLDGLIKLLKDLKGTAGNYGYEATEAQDLESKKIFTAYVMRPCISTFSDHIAISYRADDMLIPENPFVVALSDAITRIGRLAFHAINLGLLIRGGVTIGELFHEDDVIVGKALNIAHELESSIAKYPRVACSPSVYSPEAQNDVHAFLRDDDGIIHLNYFESMIAFSGPESSARASWVSNVRNRIESNCEQFRTAHKLNEMSKWEWFRKQFEDARKKLPSGLFGGEI
jgi:hypothetical protein